MTPELIGIITVGVALAALNLALFNMLNKRLERLEDRVSSLETACRISIDAWRGSKV